MADQTYFVRIRGKVSGPFDVATLQKLVQRGVLSRAHELSVDRNAWRRASQYVDLFPSAESALAVGRAGEPSAEVRMPARTASVAKPQEQPALYECSICSGRSTANDVYADRSSRTGYICRECHSPNEALATAVLGAQYAQTNSAKRAAAEGHAGTVFLILVIVGIFLMGGGVLYFMLQPPKRSAPIAVASSPRPAGDAPAAPAGAPVRQPAAAPDPPPPVHTLPPANIFSPEPIQVQPAIQEDPRALFLKSNEFADLKRKADSIVNDLNTNLIAEDSAYRGMSERAEASRNLLALYVKAEGRLHGNNVDASVDHILSDTDTSLITDDSAIRAIYENDEAFLEVLGQLCKVMDRKGGSLQREFDTQSHAATIAGIGDDSAVRGISNYSDTSMRVLQVILAAQGLGPKANAVVSKVQTQNIGDDSAWQDAMNNEQGNMRLLLLVVSQEDPAAAAKIQSDADTATIGDDSALRAQEAFIQGKVDALHWLVDHP